MAPYELKQIATLNVKDADFSCISWDNSKNEAVNILSNSELEDKGVSQTDFGANKTPIAEIREGAFGGTYFRDIYSGINGKWYKKSWKEFDQLKNNDQEYYCSDHYDCSVNKYSVKYETSLRFWENKG